MSKKGSNGGFPYSSGSRDPHDPHGLTRRQRAFVNEYMVDKNGTQAAIRAGYSFDSAAYQGSTLLTNPKVTAALADREKAAQKKTEWTFERLLEEYGKIAGLSMSDLGEWGPNGFIPSDSKTLDKKFAAAVQEVSSVHSQHGVNIKLKAYDKKGALDSIAKLLGYMRERHEVEHSGEVAQVVQYEFPRNGRGPK